MTFDISKYAEVKKKKKGFLRRLKVAFKLYKRGVRKKRKAYEEKEKQIKLKKNNEKEYMQNISENIEKFESEIKQEYKNKKQDISLNKTIIIVVVIMAVTWCYIENMKISQANKVRIEKEVKHQLQVDLYNSCMKDSDSNYSYNWNRACKSLGKKNDCSLPGYRADSIEEWRKQAEKTCLDKLNNNAF